MFGKNACVVVLCNFMGDNKLLSEFAIKLEIIIVRKFVIYFVYICKVLIACFLVCIYYRPRGRH